LLIYYTQKPELYWPLYGIPIFIAALTYNILGALIAGTASILMISWWVYWGGNVKEVIYQFAIGMAIFFFSGIFLGVFAARQKSQRALLERLSMYDRLTGLYNSDYFSKRLKEELKRAERFKHPLSLIMIDIDQFREFIATFGQVKGNRLLNKLARVIRRNTRETDIIARCSEEKFAVILPNVDERAPTVAERIRKAVE